IMPPRMTPRSAGQATAAPRVDGLVEEVEELEVELVIRVMVGLMNKVVK
ncbi:hypothetical protein Tco_0391665, partial [Tanacetum coccineum]